MCLVIERYGDLMGFGVETDKKEMGLIGTSRLTDTRRVPIRQRDSTTYPWKESESFGSVYLYFLYRLYPCLC